MKKIILKVFIITFIISGLLGIFLVLADSWNELSSRIYLSNIVIFSCSVPGVICSGCYDKGKNKAISGTGTAICIISCLYFLALIWNVITFDFFNFFIWKLMAIFIILTASSGHICLLLYITSDDPASNGFKYTTIGISLLLDVLWIAAIILDISLDAKLIVILIILIVLGTIVTPLVSRLYATSDSSFTKEDEFKYEKLEQLKKLLDSQAITQEEYEIEKCKILKYKL